MPTEQVPDWYHGATGDWADNKLGLPNITTSNGAAPQVAGVPTNITPKAAVQNALKMLVTRNPLQKTEPSTDWKAFAKDLGVDAASQAPLALIPGGSTGKTLLRAATSFLAGTGADQLANPNKPLADSGVDAALNTGVGMAIPHVLANETKFSPPDIQGTGTSAPFLKLLNLINPGNYKASPRTITRNTTQGLKQVPENIGDIISNKLFVGTNGKVDLDPKAILNLFGFGANAGIDSTINRPKKDQ